MSAVAFGMTAIVVLWLRLQLMAINKLKPANTERAPFETWRVLLNLIFDKQEAIAILIAYREGIMQLGLVGLGRMGANMVRRLEKGGHKCTVFDLNAENVKKLVAEGASGAGTLEELVKLLPKPRIVWVMVPARKPTENTVQILARSMEEGDIIIDGGNSFYKDDIRRACEFKKIGIHYCDAGTSGGVWGVERGYCLMVGAEEDTFAIIEPIIKTLAPGLGTIERTPGFEATGGTAEQGYLRVGPPGAGHFVKMIHNGIEYGIMQAYAEGFDV